MHIDDDKIVALLAEQIGQSPGKTRDQLIKFKKTIEQVTQTGEPFVMDDFGTFCQKENGLQFESHEQLQMEINQHYAGMQPVEIMAASKKTGAGVPVEEKPPEKLLPVKEAAKKPQAAQPSIKDEKTAEIPASPVEPTPEDPKEPVMSPDAEANKETTEPKSSKKVVPKPRPAFGRRRQNNSAITRAVLATVVVIIILGTGWFLYDHGALRNLTGKRQGAVVDSSLRHAPKQQLAITSAKDSAKRGRVAGDSTEQNASANVSKQQSGNQQVVTSTKYGLHGSFNSQIKGAYTIVIYSFHLKSTVQTIADSLQKSGYRTVIFHGQKQGSSWWRLGLGQFKDDANARDSARTLTAPYKKHHFINRITRK